MGKKVAILQSNYIPWKGYFDIINMVDEFIIYDDMQYTRRDWRNRNKRKTKNGVEWLTIPVRAESLEKKINETLVYDCFDIALYFFIRKTSYEDDLERLFIKIDKDQAENHKQYLVDKKNNQYINLKDIIYVQSHRNTCTFYTEDNEYVQYTTLKKCSEELCSNVAFYKINSYTIINFKYVTKINNQNVTLMNSQTFNVSRKSKDIIEKYHAYRRYMQR